MTFEEFLIQSGIYTIIEPKAVKQYLQDGYTVSYFRENCDLRARFLPTPATLKEIINSDSLQIIHFDPSTGFCVNYPPRADFHNVSETHIPTHIDKLTFPSNIGWSGAGGEVVTYISTIL